MDRLAEHPRAVAARSLLNELEAKGEERARLEAELAEAQRAEARHKRDEEERREIEELRNKLATLRTPDKED